MPPFHARPHDLTLQVSVLPVFYAQAHAAAWYPAWAYALPTLLLRLPFSVLDAVLYSALLYNLLGLAPGLGHWAVFVAYFVALHQTALSAFRAAAATGRSYAAANNIGATVLLLLLLLGGYILTPSEQAES